MIVKIRGASTSGSDSPSSDSGFAERMAAVERLTELFKLERFVHLSVTFVSLLMLLTSAGVLLFRGNAGPAELTGLFGSSGLITYSAGRLLYMWSQALKLLAGESLGGAQ
jgi:hypothetical protein